MKFKNDFFCVQFFYSNIDIYIYLSAYLYINKFNRHAVREYTIHRSLNHHVSF